MFLDNIWSGHGLAGHIAFSGLKNSYHCQVSLSPSFIGLENHFYKTFESTFE